MIETKNTPTSTTNSKINCGLHKPVNLFRKESDCPTLHSIAQSRAQSTVFFTDADLCTFKDRCLIQKCFTNKENCDALIETSKRALRKMLPKLEKETQTVSEEQNWSYKYAVKELGVLEYGVILLILIIIIVLLVTLAKMVFRSKNSRFGGGNRSLPIDRRTNSIIESAV